jgi:hypothetical protein
LWLIMADLAISIDFLILENIYINRETYKRFRKFVSVSGYRVWCP